MKQRKKELLDQYAQALSQLKKRLDKITANIDHLDLAAKAYFEQLRLALNNLQEQAIDKRGQLTNNWLLRYDQLMASLLRPTLPSEFRGSPAYYLRDAYAKLADLSYKFVDIRQKLLAQLTENRPLNTSLSQTVDYFVAPRGELVLSLWGNWLRRRLVLPVIVCWDAVRRVGNYLLGGFFMRSTILPALGVKDWRSASLKNHDGFENGFDEQFDWDDNLAKQLPEGIVMRCFHLVDEANAVACMELAPEGVNPDDPELKTVIYFLGNHNICYASLSVYLDDMISVSREGAPCRFVFWHYPGVLNSFGFPRKPADLVRSGLAVVEHVLGQGSTPDNLILKGHSLGGYVATHVAYCCHHMNVWVRLWNDRSFSDAPEYITACAVTRWGSGYRLRNFFVRMIVYAAYPLMWLVTRAVQCEAPSCYFFTRLKKDCADYIVVRSAPEVRAQGKVLDDTIIQDSASLDKSWWFRVYAWWRSDGSAQEHHYYTPTRLEEDAHQAPLKILLPSFRATKENAQRRFARFVARRS